MLRDSVLNFSLEQLRPAAQSADTVCAASDDLLKASADLGFAMMGIPDELGGAGQERSVVTNALVAEAMAQGDMGLALACLAPSAVSTALVLWGNEEQQSLYLPAFTGEKAPAAALAVLEPGALFDAFSLKTRAAHNGSGYILNGVKSLLNGVKSLVPLAAQAELFIIAAQLENEGPALFIVESSTRGIQVEAEPAMCLRNAYSSRVSAGVPWRQESVRRYSIIWFRMSTSAWRSASPSVIASPSLFRWPISRSNWMRCAC